MSVSSLRCGPVVVPGAVQIYASTASAGHIRATYAWLRIDFRVDLRRTRFAPSLRFRMALRLFCV
jgi:hypothetical protein